jgi:hypothetical protein
VFPDERSNARSERLLCLALQRRVLLLTNQHQRFGASAAV